jgi:hypothetical protein
MTTPGTTAQPSRDAMAASFAVISPDLRPRLAVRGARDPSTRTYGPLCDGSGECRVGHWRYCLVPRGTVVVTAHIPVSDSSSTAIDVIGIVIGRIAEKVWANAKRRDST